MGSIARIFMLGILFFGISSAEGQTPKKFALRDAIKEGYVVAKLTGKGGFTGDVVEMEMENLSDFQIEIAIEAGRKLCPRDTTVQTLIVTREMIVSLEPKQKKKNGLFAMCGQAHDMAPGTGDAFRFGPMGNENIKGIAKLISQKNGQNNIGQWAMWCVTDGFDPEDMPDYDSSLASALKKYVDEVKAKPAVATPEPQPDDIPWYRKPGGFNDKEELKEEVPWYAVQHKRAFDSFKEEENKLPEFMRHKNTAPPDAAVNSGYPKAVYTISGEVSVNVTVSHDIFILAYDENGKFLKRISAYTKPAIGTHRYSFKVTDPAIRGTVYVRVQQDGNVLKQIKYDLR